MKKKTEQKLDLVRDEHPALSEVAWELLINQPDRDCALVATSGNYQFGVADHWQKGYTPVPAWSQLYEDFETRQEVAAWFNENILGLSTRESAKIILSSMAR